MIRSAPSDLDVLLRSLPALANHAIELVDHMDQVFSDRERRGLQGDAENARQASERSPQLLKEIEVLVADLKHASQHVDRRRRGFPHRDR